MHASSGSLSLSPRSIAHSSTAKAAPTAWPTFLARFPEPATEYDRSGLTNTHPPVGLTSLNPVGDSSIYLVRTRGRRPPSSPIPRVGLGGHEPLADSTVLGALVPRTENAALGGILLNFTAYHDFRTHEPRINNDGLSASPGRFVARLSASVATTDSCIGRWSISHAADTVFASGGLPHPSRTARGPQKPWLQQHPSHSRFIYPGVIHRRRPPPRPPVRLCLSPPFLALQPLRRRRRTDEQ